MKKTILAVLIILSGAFVIPPTTYSATSDDVTITGNHGSKMGEQTNKKGLSGEAALDIEAPLTISGNAESESESVSEPATLLLCGIGLLCLSRLKWKNIRIARTKKARIFHKRPHLP